MIETAGKSEPPSFSNAGRVISLRRKRIQTEEKQSGNGFGKRIQTKNFVKKYPVDVGMGEQI